MPGFNLDAYMESYIKLEDSLSEIVKISHSEVVKLVVKRLISNRNSMSLTDENQPDTKTRDAFDIVLRWYIDEDEFQRYVINGEEVK